MEVSGFDQRQLQVFREYRKEHGWVWRSLGGLALVLVGVWIGAHVFVGDNGYYTNLYTEGLSIAVTVFVLNEFAKRRQIQQLKDQLIRNAASTSNEIAKDAVHQLRRQGWLVGENGLLQGENLVLANLTDAILEDGNLSGAKLLGADLLDATLYRADLRDVELQKADLSGAKLQQANFKGAFLTEANLNRTQLQFADLSGVNLYKADLRNANLYKADLRGANLESADLNGAQLGQVNLSRVRLVDADLRNTIELESATFDTNTTLPDGSKWTSETDIGRFTNYRHPNFWHPEDGRW